MNLILGVLYIYIAAYSLYFLIIAFQNLNKRKFDRQKKRAADIEKNRLCVMIYAHNNEKGVTNIIQQLKEQSYPLDNFFIYLILDNCDDDCEKKFEFDSMVQVYSVVGQGTVGKDQAISMLLEEIFEKDVCDAYVFLDADRFIDKDFLVTVNAGLSSSSVISGSTILVGEDLNLRQKIKMTYHKYQTNFLLRGRTVADLAMPVDSNVFIIKSSLLRRIGSINFKDINSELKYSLLLSKLGYHCTFNPNIKTYVGIDDVRLRIPSLSARLDLFKEGWPQTFIGADFKFTEHIYSLLSPNIIILLLAYEFLMEYSFEYYFIVDFSIVLLSFCMLVLGFAISLINSKLKGKEYLYLFLYPFYSVTHIFKNFPVFRFVRNKISGKQEKPKIEKFVVNVEITDGRLVIPCTMELISESGLAKVKFIFKNKKFTTKTHLRMIDAISEVVNKLKERDLTIKICQCCANFTQNIDGSTNMINGFCNQQYAVSQSGQKIPTLLWNSCQGFTRTSQQSLMEEISKQ